ncbi:MAG TPA: YicC/YloC family endoribonuclease [Ignavibacteria bacterium]|nr:YicC/YloC family endoribonuclease [Ignavibacteria bacterium]
MIISMTGFGTASKTIKKSEISVEIKSINSKFLEVYSRLPMVLSDRDSEVREIIASKITRGKVSVNVSIGKEKSNSIAFQVQPEVVKECYNLLNQIKKSTGIKEEIKIEHILKFSEIFKPEENEELEQYWMDIKKVIDSAANDLLIMKKKEGKVLEKDIMQRIKSIGLKINKTEKLSGKNIKDTKQRMVNRVNQLIEAAKLEPDNSRIEYELIMISDKMDITEEIIRAYSHINYFKKNAMDKELSGRRLGFLVQEINREINTIASKSNNSHISQLVVEMKEDLEKIKEQLQNIE